MNTTKLRMVISPRGWIAAYFPDNQLDGKLFWGDDMNIVVRYMYARRLRKQVFKFGG